MNSTTFRYVIIGAWGLLIACLPFIVSTSLFFPFIVGKNLFFRVIVDIVLIIWLASCFQDVSLRPKWSCITGIFAGFVLWVGIADFAGIDPLRSFWSNFERMEGYITILHLFALFLVSAQSMSKDLWYQLMGWSVVISGFTWLQGMVEHLKDTFFRIDGSFGNATYFAAYAMVHVFFAALLAFRYKTSRWVWIVLGFLNLTTIFFTGTRGALIGVAGGAVLASILYLIFEWKNKTVRYSGLSVIAFVVIAVIGLGLAKNTHFIGSSPVLSRFGQLAHYVITFDIKGMLADVGRSRTVIWGIAWEGVKERPIVGWGQENFVQVFSNHYDPNIFDQEQWFDRTHNVFLDWIIASGFPGLFGYIGIFAAILWYVWKRKEFELYEKILLSGMVLAYFIHTFFVFDNITTYIFIMLIFAAVHHQAQNYEENEGRNKNNYHVENSAGLITGAVVIACVFAWMVNMPVYVTGSDLIKGMIYAQGDGKQAVNDALLKESKKYFEKALNGSEFAKVEINEQLAIDINQRVRMSQAASSTKYEFAKLINDNIIQNIMAHPDDARVNYFAGIYFTSIGNYPAAIERLEHDLVVSPNKQTIMFSLAEAYEREGNISKAVELYKTAHEIAPQFVEPRLRYVDMLVSVGKKIEAEEVMKDVHVESLQDQKYLNILMQVNRYDIIVGIFEKKYKDNPTDIQTRISLAASYVEVDRRDDAVAILQTIVRDMPQSKTQIEYFISEIKAGRNPVQK